VGGELGFVGQACKSRTTSDSPDRQNLSDIAHVAAQPASKDLRKGLRQKANLSNPFKLISPVQIPREKYSASPTLRKVSSLEPSRLMQRDVRVVTIRGVRAAMDAMASGVRKERALQTSGADADGEVVWSWRPDAGAKLAMMLRITLTTVARKPGSPGRPRISR